MATEAQVSANRSNAQKSSGPRTPEGKTKVAQNAVKHGLLARAAFLQGEDWEEYTYFHEEMLEELYPDGMQAIELAERIVDLSWRLRRAGRYQNAVFEALYDQHGAAPAESEAPPDPGASITSDPALGRMLLADFSGDRVLERVLLYERRIESSLYRARAELRQLRRQPVTSAKRGPDSFDEPWEDSGGHRQASPFASADFTLETADPAPPVIPDPGRDRDPERDRSRLGTRAHAPVAPGGATTSGTEAQGSSCKTNPIADLPKTEAVTVGSVPVRAYRDAGVLPVVQIHGQDAHATETPDGVGTNVLDAQGRACETNPIFDLPRTEVGAEPVGSVPVRAYRDAGVLPVVQIHGQDAHATETPDGVTTNAPAEDSACETNPIPDLPKTEAGAEPVGSVPVRAYRDELEQTNPISPREQTGGSVVPVVEVAALAAGGGGAA